LIISYSSAIWETVLAVYGGRNPIKRCGRHFSRSNLRHCSPGTINVGSYFQSCPGSKC